MEQHLSIFGNALNMAFIITIMFLYFKSHKNIEYYEDILKDNIRLTNQEKQLRDNLKNFKQIKGQYQRLQDKVKKGKDKEEVEKTIEHIKKSDPRLLKIWSIDIRKVGKCDICDSKQKLTAHHIYDKHNHPSLMYNRDNGVCLCDKCHKGFHAKYPELNENTPSQYRNYKNLQIN